MALAPPPAGNAPSSSPSPPLAFDLAGARAAGASDDQIASFLAPMQHFDLAGAQQAGATSTQIAEFLSSQPLPAPAPSPPQTTAGGAFMHGALESLVPSAAGMAAAGAGAEAGGALGALAGPVGAGVGALAGGVGGFLLGGYAAGKAEQAAISALPTDVQQAIGEAPEQQQAREEQHPYATMLGSIAGGLPFLRPGFGAVQQAGETAFQKFMANPIVARGFGAAAMTGMEAAQEAREGQGYDPGKLAIAAGAGALMNRETALGRGLAGAGAAGVGRLGDLVVRPGAEAAAARDPNAAVADILQAPNVDDSIARAEELANSRGPANVGEAAASLESTGEPGDAQQAKLLRMFDNLGTGRVENDGAGGYEFRTTDAAGEEVTHPVETWNPEEPPRPGEDIIAPEAALAIRDHYAQAGVDAVFYHDYPGMRFDGTMDPKQPDTVFLSNNPLRAIGQVAGHEFTHVLANTTLPDGTSLGDILNRQIADSITPEGQRYAEQMFGATAPKREAFPAGDVGDAAHTAAVQAHLVNELGADIGAEAPKFQTFLPRVVDAIQLRFGNTVAADVLGKLLNGLRQAFETVRGLFGGTEEFASRAWVNNLGDIHDTLAQMYAAKFGTPLERARVRVGLPAAPPGGGIEQAAPPAPDWLNFNREQAINDARRFGLTDEIGRLAREGRTAAEISAAIGGRLDVGAVRAVRESLGIEPAGPVGGIAFGAMPPREAAPAPPAAPPAPLLERVPREPQRLADFLRRPTVVGEGINQTTIPGGLKDPGGDVRAIMGGVRGRPGLLNEANGRTLDDAAQHAWEGGYFPEHAERPPINDFLDALRDDLQSNPPRYSEQDAEALMARREAIARNQEVDRLADQLGIDIRGLTRDQFFDEVTERLSLQEVAEEAQSEAEAHEAAYTLAEAAARRAGFEPEELYVVEGEPRTEEDLEREYQEEGAAPAEAERAGGGAEPEPAAEREGPVPVGGGPRGGEPGLAGRGPEEGAATAGAEAAGPAGGGGAAGGAGGRPDLTLLSPRRLPLPPPQAGTDLLGRQTQEPAPRREPEPTIRTDKRQTDLFGTADAAVQAQAARDQAGRGALGPRGEVRPADEGLFAPKPPDQRPLFSPRQPSQEEIGRIHAEERAEALTELQRIAQPLSVKDLVGQDLELPDRAAAAMITPDGRIYAFPVGTHDYNVSHADFSFRHPGHDFVEISSFRNQIGLTKKSEPTPAQLRTINAIRAQVRREGGEAYAEWYDTSAQYRHYGPGDRIPEPAQKPLFSPRDELAPELRPPEADVDALVRQVETNLGAGVTATEPERVVSRIAQLGSMAIKNINQLGEALTIFPRTLASKDTLFARYYRGIEARLLEGHTNLDALRSVVKDTLAQLPEDSRNRVYAGLELARRFNWRPEDTGKLIRVRNTSYWQAQHSKVGDDFVLTQPETRAFHDALKLGDAGWAVFTKALMRQAGWDGPVDPAAIRQRAQEVGAKLPEGRRLMALAGVLETAQTRGREAYFPAMRFGDVYVKVTPKIGPETEGVTLRKGRPDIQWFQTVERGTGRDIAGKNPLHPDTMEGVKAAIDALGKRQDAAGNAAFGEFKNVSPGRWESATHTLETGRLSSNPNVLRELNIPAIEKLFMLMERKVMPNIIEQAMAGRVTEGMTAQEIAAQRRQVARYGGNFRVTGGEAYDAYQNLFGAAKDTLMEAVYNDLLAGWKKRASLTPGYDADFGRAIGTHMGQVARNAADMVHREDIQRAYQDIEANHPNLSVRRYTIDYDRYMKDPHSMLSAAAQNANQVGFTWALALNPASTLKIMLHGPMMGAPVLSVGVGMGRAGTELAMGLTEAYRNIRFNARQGAFVNLEGLGRTPAERAYLAELNRQGLLHSVGTDDIRGINDRQGAFWGSQSQFMRRVMDIASSNVSAVDQANRVGIALAAYRIAQDPAALARAAKPLMENNALFRETVAAAIDAKTRVGLGTGLDPTVAQAQAIREVYPRFMLDHAAGQYGNINQSEAMRGLEGAMYFKFHGFQTRYLSTMLNLLKNSGPEGRVAGLWMAAALGLISGVYGLPFIQDIENGGDFAWKAITGVDPMIDAHLVRLLNEAGLGKIGAEILLRGPTSWLTSADMPSATGFGDILSRPASPLDLLGVVPSMMAQRLWAGFQRYRTGQGLAAAGAELLPAALRNPAMAAIQAQTGVQSTSGTMTLPAAQLSARDIATRAVGFTPLTVEHARQQGEYAAGLKESDAALRHNVEVAYASLHLRASQADRAGDPEEAASLRFEAQRMLQENHGLMLTQQGLKDAAMQMANPELYRLTRVPLRFRQQYMQSPYP